MTGQQADPAAALAGETPRLVDEWQNAPHLWNRIRRECDERAEPGQFILTGSASPRSGITRHTGTGRIARVTLRPMSLFETGASDGAVSLRALLAGETASCVAREHIGLRDIASFVCVGGWPANLGVAEAAARRSARDHLTESVLVDVPEASGVRHHRETMLALTRSVARNVATEARTSKLLADMDPDNGQSPVARQTAAACLQALRRVFVLEDQPAWPVHLRSRAVLRKSPKRHFVDPSLAAAALAASPEAPHTGAPTASASPPSPRWDPDAHSPRAEANSVVHPGFAQAGCLGFLGRCGRCVGQHDRFERPDSITRNREEANV